MLQRETESLQGHLSETEICIGVTELLGFLAVAMSTELDGAGWIISVGPSLTLAFGHSWNEKVVGGFGAISLSILSKQSIKQHLIPF